MSRVKRSLEGLSVGDAFGQLCFSQSAFLMMTLSRGESLPPGPWHYTDDTVMAASICQVLRDLGRIDPDVLANLFAQRYTEEPNRGYGGTAQGLLRRIGQGEPWQSVAASAFEGQGSAGNGAAMRAGPVGAYYADDSAAAAEAARLSAMPTHAHPDGQAGAVAVAVAAAHAARVSGCVDDAARRELLAEAIRHTPDSPTRAGLLQAADLPFEYSVETAASALGNGSRVIASDTVPFALWCAARHLDDYEAAIWAAASALGDVDTTCAIVGSIVSLAAIDDPIPPRWRTSREGLPIYIPSE